MSQDEWFRHHVIQPAYNIAFAMQQYVRNNGSLKDHPKRPVGPLAHSASSCRAPAPAPGPLSLRKSLTLSLRLVCACNVARTTMT